ncbi:MAG: response regulator [Sedimentisphaerales bacterium]|nr:response regulator [Sedimentisphaerales bacterium]
MKSSKPILLVEDDNVDVMTVKRVFNDLKIKNQLVTTANGEEALDYLKNDDNTIPGIIFLDLNMPKMNGLEFLGIIKTDETLKKIPVIVLTTSSQEEDIIESFKFSVAGYIVKSIDYIEFTEAMRIINQYWTLSKLPSNGD